MRYQVTVTGISPLIMHDGQKGLDTEHSLQLEKAEITAKTPKNRTAVDRARLRQLECLLALWTRGDKPTVPEGAIRTCIEQAARKLKQGPLVREGVIVEHVKDFHYDEKALGTTLEQLGISNQFTVGVVVQRARILRTRAKFDTWKIVFIVDADDELADQAQITTWLQIAGQRIGLGDWRPTKSGHFGRFEVSEVKALD